MSSIAHHARWMVGGKISQAGVAFMVNLLLVRLYSPEEFGKFAILLANIGLINMLVSLRLADLVIKLPTVKPSDSMAKKIAGILFLQNLIMVLIVTSFGLVLSWSVIELIVLLLGVVVANWAIFQTKMYEKCFDYQKISVIETSSHWLSHAVTVLLALSGVGPIVLYSRELVRSLSVLFGLKLFAKAKFVIPAFPKLHDVKFAINGIRGMWLDGLLEQAFDRLIILFIAMVSGDVGAGLFFQAKRLANLPHEILQPIAFRIAYNYFSADYLQGMDEKYQRFYSMTKIMLPCLAAFAIVAFLLAEPVIPRIFGIDWSPVVIIFQCLTGYMIFNTVFNMLKAFYMSAHSMLPFLILGRGLQYIVLFLGLVSGLYVQDGQVLVMASSISAAYFVASIALLLFTKFIASKRITR